MSFKRFDSHERKNLSKITDIIAIIVDLSTMESETVENTQNLNLSQGAGIQAAQTIVENQVDCLITGHCGPKAFTC